jgi:hypothetical protein
MARILGKCKAHDLTGDLLPFATAGKPVYTASIGLNQPSKAGAPNERVGHEFGIIFPDLNESDQHS